MHRSLSLMEKKIKLRKARMFSSSFGTCRSRTITDIIGKPVFIPHQNMDLIEPPKTQPYPSIHKPSCPITSKQQLTHNKCYITSQKAPQSSNLSHSGDHVAHTCHHTSVNKSTSKGLMRKKKKRVSVCFTSDEETEHEAETLFSSKRSFNFSSGSTNSRRKKDTEMGFSPLKDSFAVVKYSRDPYGDFRLSMVEMILEREMFLAEELEQLLQCFLKLNSGYHHKVILDVFMEIWEALYCN